MQPIPNFQLKFIREERHLMLPRVSSIVVTQRLYEILFQYAITKEKEVKLKAFINLLETHIKSHAKAPFSLPIEEFGFLGEGLQELKVLNWTEIPIYLFEVKSSEEEEISPESMEAYLAMLENLMICGRLLKNNQLYVYPSNLVRY